MKKLFGLTLILMLTGCACGRKDRTELYRTALKDTNASLTQCREENQALHRVVVRQNVQLKAIRKQRRQMGR